jgi:hypothetical protein
MRFRAIIFPAFPSPGFLNLNSSPAHHTLSLWALWGLYAVGGLLSRRNQDHRRDALRLNLSTYLAVFDILKKR